jgi:Domain of Unknown Function (DUF1080)
MTMSTSASQPRSAPPAARLLIAALAAVLLAAGPGAGAGAAAAAPAAAPVPVFDGMTLTGWDGDMAYWRVEDGCITGETTPARKLTKNTFLLWRAGTVSDFDIEFDYRILSDWANSGLQYRSKDIGSYLVAGYQANIESGVNNGMNYSEETGRGILALVGQRVWLGDGTTKNKVETIGDRATLLRSVKPKGEWNHYKLTAKGTTMTILINGTLLSETIDQSAKDADKAGILALQLHVGAPMKIQFKGFVLLPLTP